MHCANWQISKPKSCGSVKWGRLVLHTSWHFCCWNHLGGFCFWLVVICSQIVPLLSSLRLKTERLPILMRSVKVMSVMFTTGRFLCKACPEVVSWYLTLTGWEVRQDGYGKGQDRKCNWQAVEIHNRAVSRWTEPRAVYRVVEGRWNIKHVWYFANPPWQAGKLQFTLTIDPNQLCKHSSQPSKKKPSNMLAPVEHPITVY